MSLEEKINNVLTNGYKIRGYIGSIDIDKNLLLTVLNNNACDFIIEKLITESSNKTNIFIPGGGLSFHVRNEMSDFGNQLFSYNFETFKLINSNYVLVDPNYSDKISEGKFDDINNYRNLKRAVGYIKNHFRFETDLIISEQFILAEKNNVIYEISFKKNKQNLTFYIVGSSFYFSNLIHEILFEYPNILDTEPKKSHILTEDEKIVYCNNITELQILYLKKLDEFKKIINMSNNFLIFNCIRFVKAGTGPSEENRFSIHKNLKKFLIENNFTEKVNYLLSMFHRVKDDETKYNYYYIFPQKNADKVVEGYNEDIVYYDQIRNKEQIWDMPGEKEKYYILPYSTDLSPALKYNEEDFDGGNTHYKKYIKYKTKYLKLKYKL